jgi:hypothetical protein
MSILSKLSSIAAFEIVTTTPDEITIEAAPYGTIPFNHVFVLLKSPELIAINIPSVDGSPAKPCGPIY